MTFSKLLDYFKDQFHTQKCLGQNNNTFICYNVCTIKTVVVGLRIFKEKAKFQTSAAGEASLRRQQKWLLQWGCTFTITFTITFTGVNLVRELSLCSKLRVD